MSDFRERRCDAFLVRMWRDRIGLRFLRIEIEHIQSGQHFERLWRYPGDESEIEGKDWIIEHILGDTTRITEDELPQ